MNQPLNQPPVPTPKPPLSEQIVEILIKVIRPGGITGGGIGAAWFLLVASDIPKAMVSAGIGAMLSYGAKLLQPIHKRIERGAEWTGEVVGQVSENLVISTETNRPLATEITQRRDSPCYVQLEEYLKTQQWKKADEETYRLMIMNPSVGKKKGQGFAKEDLLNFPCNALLTIEQLWVKYSCGKWGFSVQQQIYVECGAELDGKYPCDEIWRKFAARVGWSKNGNWREYDELLFDFEKSSAGEFPVCVLVVDAGSYDCAFRGRSPHFRFFWLAQRLVECSVAES